MFTDNKTITYLKTCRLLSPRIARYALVLQEFDFDLVHISGRENVIADSLSRCLSARLPMPKERCFGHGKQNLVCIAS